MKRQVNMSDISNIGRALEDVWVVTFPQRTTTPFKPLRKGTAHIIKVQALVQSSLMVFVVLLTKKAC